MKFYAVLLAATVSSTYAEGGAFFDAGSSGTKILTYSDQGNTQQKDSVKFVSRCVPEEGKDASTFQGNSAFGMVKDTEPSCKSIKTTNDKDSSETETQPKNAVEYGQFLATEAHKLSPDASNKDAMPALATAGNRIISKALNDKIWGTDGKPGLCGQAAKDAPGTKIAVKGDKCGTIPGTREALFEAVAFHVEHAGKPKYKQDHRALFTSGGASAQISIPIYNEKDKEVFMEAVREVTAEFEKAKCNDGQCTGIKTPEDPQQPLPYFTTGLANETANAAGDFVRFWSVADIKKVIFKGEDPDEPRNLPFKRLTAKGINKATKAEEYTFLGLATISFIGLAGEGGKYYRGVAGGVNQIEAWAKEAGCDTPTWDKGKKDWTSPPTPWTVEKFNKCLKQFELDLRGDVVWRVATQVMQTLDFTNYKISYGTASIQPKALLKDQPDPKGSGAGLGEFAAVNSAGDAATTALGRITHENKYGIGKGGASIEHSMKKDDAMLGVEAVKEVAKAACTKLGHGFGFKYENTCAKAMWVYKFLSLGLSAPEERPYWETDFGNAQLLTGASKSDKPVDVAKGVAKAALVNVWYTLKTMRNHLVNMGIDLKASMKVVKDVDFGDADVAKGAAFSFKAKTHLRKGEKQQGSLQAEANTEAQMHALGMHILDSMAANTVNYMAGAAYAV